MPSPSRPVLVAATLAVVAVLATACGSTPSGAGGSASTGPTGAQPTASPTHSPGTPTPPVAGAIPADARERAQVKASIEDAARRQGVTPDDVDIAAFTPVTWNDGSLGCPRKD